MSTKKSYSGNDWSILSCELVLSKMNKNQRQLYDNELDFYWGLLFHISMIWLISSFFFAVP